MSCRAPDTSFVHVVFLLDLGLARGYERGHYIAVTGDRAVFGMTACRIAVILGTGFWSPGERLPRSFEIGCGVTVLSGDDDERTWSQRYKANLEKLASGDLVQVVEVVRELAGREASRGLSAGEKRMLARARLILLQEG